MPFEPKEFITLADKLSGVRGESAKRTAISRYYYGCFLEGKRAVEGAGWTVFDSEGPDHGRLREVLRNRHQITESRELLRLRNLRDHADYHLDALISPDWCDLCKQVLEAGGNTSVEVGNTDVDIAKQRAQRLFPKLASILPESKRG